MPSRETVIIEGSVENTNDNGLKVNGSWYDYSRYGKDVPRDIAKGTMVRMEIQNGRFINGLTRTGGANGVSQSDGEPPAVGLRYDDASLLTQAQEIRRRSLDAAIEYLINRPILPDDGPMRASSIVACADVFASWIADGIIPGRTAQRAPREQEQANAAT